MRKQIKSLIFYGILLLSIPFSAMAVEVFIDGLRYSVDENQEEDMLGGRTSNFWKTYGGKYQTITDKAVNITGDLEFQDEIKPDGATCAVGEILKRTGADNWACAADDDSGGAGDIAQLGQIGDVSTSTPMTYGEVLRYNTSTSKWESVATSTLGITGAGTVTSVAMSVPTGLTITGSPITTSGTLALTLTGGYQMLTDVASTTWDNKWDALTDITLAHQSIFVGDGSNNPVATSTLTVLDNGNVGIATATPAYDLDVYGNIRADGDIRTTGTFYGDTWSSITGNSMAVQPTGDTDDFFSFKTPADRPTIKREGGKYIYIESTNIYDAGISIRDGTDYSGTFAFEKDTDRMSLSAKNSPLIMKLNSDYDDYFLLQTTSNTPEITVASSSALKINAGGTNALLLNHAGGNVGIGTTSPLSTFSMNSGTNGFRIDSSGIVQQGTWQGTALTDAYVSNTLTVDGYMQDSDINTFAELQSWVSDEVLLKAGTLTDTKYCIYDSASGDIICNSEGGGSSFSSIATLNALMAGESVASTTNIWADSYISSASTWNAKWDALTDMVLIDNYIYVGDASNDPVGVAMSNDCTIASNGAITCDHDALDNFVANEHLDWTADLGATNIHAGNYTTLTDLTDFDQTAWRLFYSNNLGDVIELSLGTDGQYLKSQGGTASLTWGVPTNTTYLGGTNLTLDGTTFNVDDAFIVNNANDIMTGVLTLDGLTLGANENITLGSQTLDHDGTDFAFNDSVVITGRATTTDDLTIGNDGAVQPGCIVVRDIDDGGFSYGTLLNGAITWGTVDCTGAATTSIQIGR